MERSQFHGILVGLGPAVTQKKRVVFVSAGLSESAGKFFLKRVLYCVRVEAQPCQLVGQHLHIVRMGVPDGNYRMSAVEVGVFDSILVPECGVKPTDRLDVPEFVCLEKFHCQLHLYIVPDWRFIYSVCARGSVMKTPPTPWGPPCAGATVFIHCFHGPSGYM